MDVQCERCKAEYEFDDALVSGRGTTVKCTSCGHQFKIRRGDDTGDDRWTVRTTEGRELVFTSLRELQKAILARQVGRADTLTRGSAPSRALGAITELESFFEEAGDRSHSGAKTAPEAPRARAASIPAIAPRAAGSKTMVGGSPAPPPVKRQSSRPPAALGGRPAPSLRPIMTPTPPPMPIPSGLVARADAMRPRVDTIRPPASAVPPAPASTLPRPGSLGGLTDDSNAGAMPGPPVSVTPVLNAGDLIPESQSEPMFPREDTPPMPMPLSSAPPPPPFPRSPSGAPKTIVSSPPQTQSQTSTRPPPPTIQVDSSSALPPPTVPVRVGSDDDFRSALASMDETSGDHRMPGRPRRVGGWVVALVLVIGAGVIGLAVAKPYLAAKSAAPGASPLDPRAQQMLSDGERALSAGDLEAANDDFTKASALAENDPRVLVDVARLASARADVPWLKLRLLPADATDDQQATKAQLEELSTRSKRAAEVAIGASPDQPAAMLARIDALRIAGDSAGARALVSKVIATASQPDTAYALAALDLAEPEPLWPMVLERLRLAAAGEGNAGRARAALVYALARSGDPAGARQELERLTSLARSYPLAGALRSFVAKTPDPSKADAGAPRGKAIAAIATTTATVDVSSLPHPAPAGGGGGGGFRGANDPRVLLAQAESAKTSHDWDRARALYSSALAQNASDSEALAGLGDVDHGQHDLPGAATYYRRALAVNPVYLPALVGLGDVEWESGDKDQAQKTYRDIADRFPEGTYPARVKTRAEGPAGGGSAPTPAPTSGSTSGSSSGSTPATSAPSSDTPGASQ